MPSRLIGAGKRRSFTLSFNKRAENKYLNLLYRDRSLYHVSRRKLMKLLKVKHNYLFVFICGKSQT